MTEPNIYVADLAAYNAGYLHGAWLDPLDPEIWDKIDDLILSSPVPDAEEFMVHDHEGLGNLGECNVSEAVELAKKMEEHGPAWLAYVELVGDHYATVEGFENSYYGEYESEEDYAQEFYESCYEIPDHLQYYIDWEAVARDVFMDMSFSDGYVFDLNS
jgi:antirestriction protein